MRKTEHTPGAWHCSFFREIGTSPGIDIGADNNSNIALVWHDVGDRPVSETKANARLISASPDLLSALVTAQWMLERDYIDDQKMSVIEKCRAAITKAKGE